MLVALDMPKGAQQTGIIRRQRQALVHERACTGGGVARDLHLGRRRPGLGVTRCCRRRRSEIGERGFGVARLARQRAAQIERGGMSGLLGQQGVIARLCHRDLVGLVCRDGGVQARGKFTADVRGGMALISSCSARRASPSAGPAASSTRLTSGGGANGIPATLQVERTGCAASSGPVALVNPDRSSRTSASRAATTRAASLSGKALSCAMTVVAKFDASSAARSDALVAAIRPSTFPTRAAPRQPAHQVPTAARGPRGSPAHRARRMAARRRKAA